MVAVEDMATLYVIDGDTRMEIQAVKNPSNMKTLCSMKKVPGYDPLHRPYVLFKDSDYVSLFNTKLMKLLPLVRSKYDTDPLNVHNLWVTNYSGIDRKNSEAINITSVRDHQQPQETQVPTDVVIFYTLEYEKKNGKMNSRLQSYKLNLNFLTDELFNDLTVDTKELQRKMTSSVQRM